MTPAAGQGVLDFADPSGPRPVPSRITMALDAGGHFGPEVDAACGVAEPTVDLWEAGTLVPTGAQVEALAALTEYPVAWFYEPPSPAGLVVTVCQRSGKGRGCHRYVTEPHPGDVAAGLVPVAR